MVRLKTRYLVVEVMTAGGRGGGGKPMQKEDIGSLIRESIARNYGDYGVGMLQYAFQVLYFNSHTKLAVVRCAREYCKLVESSLVFVTELVAQELRLRVARVCGCSRTCRDHLLKFSMERAELAKLRQVYPLFPAELQQEIAVIDAQ